MMKIELDDGKYSYIFDEQTGEQKALRHGEPWRDLVGDKFVMSMAYRIATLTDQLTSLQNGYDLAVSRLEQQDQPKQACSKCNGSGKVMAIFDAGESAEVPCMVCRKPHPARRDTDSPPDGFASREDWLAKEHRITFDYSYARSAWTFFIDREGSGQFFTDYPQARTAAKKEAGR